MYKSHMPMLGENLNTEPPDGNATYKEVYHDSINDCRQTCTAGKYIVQEIPWVESGPYIVGQTKDESGKYPYQYTSDATYFGSVPTGEEYTEQYKAGANNCVLCSPGKSTQISNSVDCDFCEAGKYTPNSGDQCIACEAGKFSGVGAPFCEDCPLYKISETTGSTECTDCAVGYRSTTGLPNLPPWDVQVGGHMCVCISNIHWYILDICGKTPSLYGEAYELFATSGKTPKTCGNWCVSKWDENNAIRGFGWSSTNGACFCTGDGSVAYDNKKTVPNRAYSWFSIVGCLPRYRDFWHGRREWCGNDVMTSYKKPLAVRSSDLYGVNQKGWFQLPTDYFSGLSDDGSYP